MAAWTSDGHDINVSINLSVRNLHDRSLFDTLRDAVSEYGLSPERIDLEITESSLMDDVDYCSALIGQLRDRGYSVSIDDFGTGHASLAYLKHLPVTTVKIDQAFVRDLATNVDDQTITRAIVEMATALRLRCVAEGIEDEESAELLRDWGCDYGQGFLFHRPCPSDDFLALMDKSVAAPIRAHPAQRRITTTGVQAAK
jgi:EAL domain-containing protein (putative c-di-GMP-specific phosphodiesterase class I)